MKNRTCYYIKFNRLIDDDEDIFEQFKQKCIEVLDSSIDSEYVVVGRNKDYEYLFLFWEEYKTKSFLEFLLNVKLVDTHKDVSENLIDETIFQLEDFTDVYVTNETDRDEDCFGYKKMFNDYILATKSKDDVLDKINRNGFESLTKIDKKILNT